MMSLKTAPFDAAQYLSEPEDQAALLSDAFATGDISHIATALGVVARARGMTHVAREAGVTREALYKALGPGGDPRLSTLLGVARALGVSITASVGRAGLAEVEDRWSAPTPLQTTPAEASASRSGKVRKKQQAVVKAKTKKRPTGQPKRVDTAA